MKKVAPTLRRSFTLFLLAGIMVTVVLTCNTMKGESETELPLQSPIRPATPTPTATPLSARDTSPLATPTLAPMAAKATVAALGSQHQSEVTRTLTPIKSNQDIVDVVLNDPLFQRYLDDSMFGPNSKDAVPGEPIAVRLISNRYLGQIYYIVPFYKDGYVTGLATVWVEDGMGGMGMWGNTHSKYFPFVDALEATKLVEGRNVTVMGEPELVFRPTREGGIGWINPFWEVKTEEGITFYVIQNLNKAKIYRADEIHPID